MGKGIRQNRFVRSQKGLALKVRRVDLRGEGLEGSHGRPRTGKAGLPFFLFSFRGLFPFRVLALWGVGGFWEGVIERERVDWLSCLWKLWGRSLLRSLKGAGKLLN